MTTSSLPAHSSEAIHEIPVDAILESPHQHRKNLGDLSELKDSMESVGILQPLLVRPIPMVGSKDGKTFELVFGHRRLRAAQELGIKAVGCQVRNLTDVEVLAVQLVENLQRVNVAPLEEAEGFHYLATAGKYGVEMIAAQVGRSVKYVYDRMKLLSLTKESQALMEAGKITAGHAILLARLKPADQARAIDDEKGGLFQDEYLLWEPERERDGEKPLKSRSVRELQAWIDKHVRFDPEAEDLPQLFPETAGTLSLAREVAEKIIPITWDYSVQPDVRDGNRVFGPRSWKRASGDAKPCDRAVTGVIVAGPGRGEAFRVCTDKKKCSVHWGKEQREAKKRATQMAKSGDTGKDRWQKDAERRKAELAKEEAQRARWMKARPAILKALAEKVRMTLPNGDGLLAGVIANRLGGFQRRGSSYLSPGGSAEDFMRHAALQLLSLEANEYRAPWEFAKKAGAFGVDVREILDRVVPKAPVQTSAEAGTGKPRKAGKSKKIKRKKATPE